MNFRLSSYGDVPLTSILSLRGEEVCLFVNTEGTSCFSHF